MPEKDPARVRTNYAVFPQDCLFITESCMRLFSNKNLKNFALFLLENSIGCLRKFAGLALFRISNNPWLIAFFFGEHGMVKPHGEKFYGISYGITILIMIAGIVRVSKDEHIIQR